MPNPTTAKPESPKSITLIEVGPRDGLQFEKTIVPTPLKVEIISGLAAAGIKMIQVAAFVSPRRVPQMADADRLPALLESNYDVTYNYLVLNQNGLDRAIRSGASSVEISASASDTHSRKNTGMPRTKAISGAIKMIGSARKHGLHIRASIQCAFGCAYEGAIDAEFVLSTARSFLSRGPDMLVLADTTGMAEPTSVKVLLDLILPEAGETPIALHLHDTHGFGLANVVAAMEQGITHFDASLAGLGGCPFIPGAAGNISTEETARMLTRMNIRTGIKIDGVAQCSKQLLAYLALQNKELTSPFKHTIK